MKNSTERRKDAGEMRVKDEMFRLVRDSSARGPRARMLPGGYGRDGQYGLNGPKCAVRVSWDWCEVPRAWLIAKVYFPEPERYTAERSVDLSGMNGISLPSEVQFNHVCRFRRWVNLSRTTGRMQG